MSTSCHVAIAVNNAPPTLVEGMDVLSLLPRGNRTRNVIKTKRISRVTGRELPLAERGENRGLVGLLPRGNWPRKAPGKHPGIE